VSVLMVESRSKTQNVVSGCVLKAAGPCQAVQSSLGMIFARTLAFLIESATLSNLVPKATKA